jgi:FkbM family methyltransferase
MMRDMASELKDNFTIVNLGCIGDQDFVLPARILKAITLVEIDAEGGAVTSERYHRKISIKQPIAGKKGRYVFHRNNFAGTCSLLEPLPGIVESFGMENYCRVVDRMEMDCDTLPNLLRTQQIKTLDFLKTDIEGLDYEVIRSCEEFLGKTHFIQCELRFRPFYQAEPYFHETVNLLARHGYEVLDIAHIDRWKYKTARRPFQVQGRAQWADFLFVLQPERLAETFGNELPLAIAKQVVLACMLGKKNYAEYLLDKFKEAVPADWRQELLAMTVPRFPGIQPFLTSLRRSFFSIELFLKHRIGKSEFVAIR